MNENLNVKTKNKPLSIIILIGIIVFITVILIIFFNQTTAKEIFTTTIDNLKDKIREINEQTKQEEIAEKMTFENHFSFHTDIPELTVLNDYKLDTTWEYDHNYFDLFVSLANNDKRIIDTMLYIINNEMFFESDDLYNRPIKLMNLDNLEITFDVTFDDYFYLIDKFLEYFNNSLIDDNFSQNKQKITIVNQEINVMANNYLIDKATYEKIRDYLVNDDHLLEILANLFNTSKENIINNLKEETTLNYVNETVGLSEAQMIYSGIDNYCATSAMKALLDSDYFDICSDGVAIDEVTEMVNLGNAEVVKITYNNQIDELIIKSNGYIYTLQSDGSFISAKDELKFTNMTITIYTDKKDNFIGYNLASEEKTICNYTFDNNQENFIIYLGDDYVKGKRENAITDISFFEDDREVLNLNFKIDENSINFNLDTPNAKDYLGLSYKQNNIIIDENQTTANINITLFFGNENNPYSIEILNDATIYENGDITMNNPNDYIEIEQLTEEDINDILSNLQQQLEGTIFQSLLELFLVSF